MLTNSTLAALTIASAPSTIAANERASNNPNASAMTVSPYLVCTKSTAATFHFSAGHTVDRLFGGFRRDVHVLLVAADVDAAEAAERPDFEDVDLGGFLGLVGGKRGVRGRGDFHREKCVARQDHVAVPGAVDEHRVVIVDAADDVVAVNLWLVSAFLFEIKRGQNCRAGLADISLRLGVNLQHAIEAFDDLHA